MYSNHNIKDGLKCQIASIPAKGSNSASLIKSKQALTLGFNFNLSELNTTNNGNKLDYEIKIIFEDTYLKRFSSAEQTLATTQFTEEHRLHICCTSQMLLHEIVNCKLDGVFRNMYLESKAILLLLCFQNNKTPEITVCDTCKFLTNPDEKDKIIKAREIILTNLDQPLTIPVLAQQLGINQCYLKKGFKEIYGSTIYDFVQTQRMTKARLLLNTNKYSVSQVAEQVGFSSQSSFSNAFKKITGVYPSELPQQ